MQTIMATGATFADLNAFHRYQIGTLHEAPGEITVWTRNASQAKAKAKHIQLRPLSSPLTPTANYTAIRIPYPEYVSPSTNKALYPDGGDIFVQFRDFDTGYTADISETLKDKVYVHHRYANSDYTNEYRTYTGHGALLFKILSPGGSSYTNEKLGLSIFFCGINGAGLADISIAGTESEAEKGCPHFNQTTTKPAWANRCDFVPMGQNMIDGYRGRWIYETFYLAELKCHQEPKCMGIYQSKPGAPFEVRDGGVFNTYRKSNIEGSQSWACFGFLPNGKMITAKDTTAPPKDTVNGKS